MIGCYSVSLILKLILKEIDEKNEMITIASRQKINRYLFSEMKIHQFSAVVCYLKSMYLNQSTNYVLSEAIAQSEVNQNSETHTNKCVC